MAREEKGSAVFDRRPDAREAFALREAGEVASILLHVIAESFPERARVRVGHELTVDADEETALAQERSSSICFA